MTTTPVLVPIHGILRYRVPFSKGRPRDPQKA
jgi:hypothetical protein